MKAVFYGRYSSDKQTEDSIEAQRRACEGYAAAHGLVIVGEYVDEAISGKGSATASRAQYQRLLRDCDKGIFDAILIHKFDRVARSLAEHVNLEKRLHDSGVTLVAVAQDFGSSNEAKIMRGLMWILSEYYSDNLSDEVKKGLKENALKGLHNGGYPLFGYRVEDQQYFINEFEAVFVRKMFHAAANRQGFTAIIEELDAAGIRGRHGKPIRYTQIYEMLRNERYTGTYVYCPGGESTRENRRTKPNGIRVENALPAIIDKALFEEVQQIMSERKQTGKKAGYLCSGLVYCSCGGKMHGMKSKKGGFERTYYYCSKKCGAGTVRMEDVDRAVTEYLKILLSDENQLKIAAVLKSYDHSNVDRVADFNNMLSVKIDEKQKQYDALMKNLSAGALPPKVVEDIGRQMQTLQEEIEALRHMEPPQDYTTDTIKAWLDSIKKAPDEKVVHLLIERIDIKDKTDFKITSTLKSVLGKNGLSGGT